MNLALSGNEAIQAFLGQRHNQIYVTIMSKLSNKKPARFQKM